MRPQQKTISSTGNSSKGFTFVEIMVALVILSAGIVMIYRSFFLSVDYLQEISCRLHALNLLEDKIGDISRRFRDSADGVIDAGDAVSLLVVNNRQMNFNVDIRSSNVGQTQGLYQLDLILWWQVPKGRRQLTRSIYLAK